MNQVKIAKEWKVQAHPYRQTLDPYDSPVNDRGDEEFSLFP
jgi:hypothetical protein